MKYENTLFHDFQLSVTFRASLTLKENHIYFLCRNTISVILYFKDMNLWLKIDFSAHFID